MKVGTVLPTASAVAGAPVVYLGAPKPREDDEAFPDVPSVEFGGTPNARLNYLSVSQLKTASLCLRKWWLKKVAGLEEPKSAALEIGTEVHAQLEHYLKTGEDVLGEIARPALRYLPEPNKAGTLLEQPITKQVRPIAEVRAFLVKYFKTGIGQGLDEPAHTITTKHRLGLVTVALPAYLFMARGPAHDLEPKASPDASLPR